MKKLNVKISISRPSYPDRRDSICIRLQDEDSHITFFEGDMTASDFALAITGLSSLPIDSEVSGLEFIGKKKIQEKRQIICPLTESSKIQGWLHENCQEEGWILNPYLGSQRSKKYLGEKGYELNYSVFKYVEEDES